MKRLHILVLLIAGVSVLVFSCQKSGDGDKKDSEVSVTGVTLNVTSITLSAGEEYSLIATVAPGNATNRNVMWSSSDGNVATVVSGKVTALKEGAATITVITEDGGKTASCLVAVKSGTVSVTGVSLNRTSAELTVGETLSLTATVAPENATNKNVMWSSSDGNVATVTGGKVTALKEGAAMITVTTEDGGKTATCLVAVKSGTVSVTGVSLNRTSAELTVGETLSLTATVAPENATNKNVMWSSSDGNVATVVGGKVTALKEGAAMITVTTEDGGKTASCLVAVKSGTVSVTGVSLNRTSAELTVGETLSLTATVAPENATNKNVMWSSSDGNVATVVGGKVTALKEGAAMITVTTEDGGKTASCLVKVFSSTNVEDPVSGEDWTWK